MTSKRVFLLMLVITISLVFGIFGSVVFSNKLLRIKSEDLVSVKLENRLLDEQQAALAQANKAIKQYEDLNNIAKAIVPQDKDQARVVREISKIASETGIELSTISFPASTLGQPATKNSNEGGSGGTPKASSSGITQVKPVDGIKGVFVMEITIQQSANKPVTFEKMLGFLERLENNRRTAQVTNVAVLPNAQDRSKLTFNLSVNTYIKP